MRAKLHPINRRVGYFQPDNKCCEVCKYITENDTFTSNVIGENFKINHHFGFNDKCLVYLLTCTKRRKQYTGQNTDTFVEQLQVLK